MFSAIDPPFPSLIFELDDRGGLVCKVVHGYLIEPLDWLAAFPVEQLVGVEKPIQQIPAAASGMGHFKTLHGWD